MNAIATTGLPHLTGKAVITSIDLAHSPTSKKPILTVGLLATSTKVDRRSGKTVRGDVFAFSAMLFGSRADLAHEELQVGDEVLYVGRMKSDFAEVDGVRVPARPILMADTIALTLEQDAAEELADA